MRMFGAKGIVFMNQIISLPIFAKEKEQNLFFLMVCSVLHPRSAIVQFLKQQDVGWDENQFFKRPFRSRHVKLHATSRLSY